MENFLESNSTRKTNRLYSVSDDMMTRADGPPIKDKTPPLRTRGRPMTDPLTWGGQRGLVVGLFDYGPIGRRFESTSYPSTFPSVVHDWVIKGLGMFSRV